MNGYFEIGGIKIDNMSYSGILQKIEDSVISSTKTHIITVNPEIIVYAFKNNDFLHILKNAEIKTADGVGIIWASEYLSKPAKKGIMERFIQFIGSFKPVILPSKRNKIKERVTGSDLLPEIIKLSAEKNWRIFLLGATEGVAETVVKKFKILYPNAIFAGSYAGSSDESHDNEICGIINKVKPDILFVAFGSPKQEFWIKRNLAKLDSVKVAAGVGGAFDFHSGKIKRAPMWMRKAGLEWLWRLILQPSRIKRIWNATFVFMKLVIKEKREKTAQ